MLQVSSRVELDMCFDSATQGGLGPSVKLLKLFPVLQRAGEELPPNAPTALMPPWPPRAACAHTTRKEDQHMTRGGDQHMTQCPHLHKLGRVALPERGWDLSPPPHSPHCLLLFHISPVSTLPSLHCPNMWM